MKNALVALLVLLAAGCFRGPRIDTSRHARSQDSRVRFLVLHFTQESWSNSLRILTEGDVSSHYLVRDNPVRIYRLVDENRRAYHAGLSSWKGQTQLNSASIGIEIVNGGAREGPEGLSFADYPPAQVDAVIDLVRDIAARHGIPGENILGHAEIAPQRKLDPGPKFPWQRLADAGLIPWPDPAAVAGKLAAYRSRLPAVAWFQARLAQHGYETPRTGELDPPTRRVLGIFQMKYRPRCCDGTPDAETAALLDVLTTPPPEG
ncbi:MAG: N-acetylmuramoyl-L-alanine amidase [Acidobacteria bacterium]|nr:N-acetylmuramoyl-L-alanine amidase [Acidobacteriota bacterium]